MNSQKNTQNAMDEIYRIIIDKVYVENKEEQIGIFSDEDHWIFDFRRVIMKASILDSLGEIFWEKYKDKYPFQICSLEVAGIPLSVGLTMKIYQKGKKDMNGFFVRKSRKKNGLMKMIEGTIEKDKKIILADDIINSGKSFIRQVEVLEELGHKVEMVWAILGFRDKSFYSYFKKKGIKVETLFDLNDLQSDLGNRISNRKLPDFTPAITPFSIQWKFSAEKPNYMYVVPKSDPTLDDDKIYFGSDDGYFWAINQSDGSMAWKFKVGFHPKGKSIFSNPIVYKNMVIFGSYDGNLYALDRKSGKKIWVFFDADWIGSSPALSEKLGFIFVGLEFGLFRKRGGIVAIDINSGKKKWQDLMPSFTHSSPLYIPEKKQVIIGSNDGIVRLYHAKSGKKIWEFTIGEIHEYEKDSGFSHLDIKESFVYDSQRDYFIFGSSASFIFIINAKNGSLVKKIATGFGSYSTPIIYNNKLYHSSLDKNLYCIDLDTFEIIWKWNAGARIFGSAVIIENSIYIGANTGRMTEINPETGKVISFITVPERITGSMKYNKKTDTFFLPTFANEIYSLKKNMKKGKRDAKNTAKKQTGLYLRHIKNGFKN